jgi:PaaX protein central Cas2-like domain
MSCRARRKSPATYSVLNYLSADVTVGDALLAFLRSMGSVSLYRHYMRYGVAQKVPSQKEKDAREVKRLYQRFSTIVYRLKKEGIIVPGVEGESKQKTQKFKITKKGRNILSAQRKYQKCFGSDLIIVMFDIPEKLRLERTWLRSVLKELDFEMVQRSVWMGKAKIPEQFVEDMRDRKIVEYVEIIKVSTPGTIERLKSKK